MYVACVLLYSYNRASFSILGRPTYSRLSAEELMLLNCGAGEDLRVPWTSRRSSQSILKEINPEYLLEGPMLKLKLQQFGHLMRRANSLEKTDAEAEASILWSPDLKSQLIRKDPDAGKD